MYACLYLHAEALHKLPEEVTSLVPISTNVWRVLGGMTRESSGCSMLYVWPSWCSVECSARWLSPSCPFGSARIELPFPIPCYDEVWEELECAHGLCRISLDVHRYFYASGNAIFCYPIAWTSVKSQVLLILSSTILTKITEANNFRKWKASKVGYGGCQ